MPWWKSKWFYLNLIALVINVIQYVVTSNLLPAQTTLLTSIIGILQLIANVIAGTVQSNRMAKAKLKKGNSILR